MVFQLSRRAIPPQKDPHDWNTWDHYRTVHELRLNQHTFVLGDTLTFSDGGESVVSLIGEVICLTDVAREVEIWFAARYFGNALRIRAYSFRYIGWLRGERLLLKYHNLHKDPHEYHHRVYDPTTGVEVFHETLHRYQFPTFSEVLDELEYLAESL